MAIHPTAIIDSKAEIDGSAEIGPFCVIEENVRIAAGCRLYHNVYVTGWTTVEQDCVFHPGVIVGHEPQDTDFQGARSFCRVGRGTVLRENVSVHRGTKPETETVVGEACFLLGGSHVAHNCVLGRGVTLVNNVLLAGYVEVGDGAIIGGGAVMHQFVRVGALAMITGNARLPKDVPPYSIVDEYGRISGLNRVGLDRAGFSRDDYVAIRRAYHIIYADDRPKRDTAERIAALGDTPPLRALITFLDRESRRGLARRSRRRSTKARAAEVANDD